MHKLGKLNYTTTYVEHPGEILERLAIVRPEFKITPDKYRCYQVFRYTFSFNHQMYLIKPHPTFEPELRYEGKGRYFRYITIDAHTFDISSTSFPKFGHYKAGMLADQDLSKYEFREKLDGTNLVIGMDNQGNLIARSRHVLYPLNRHSIFGFDMNTLNDFLDKHKDLWSKFTPNEFSAVFEVIHPKRKELTPYDLSNAVFNPLVSKSEITKFYLTGMISNKLWMTSQDRLDKTAEEHGLLRPTRYSFNTEQELINELETNTTIEGFVCYTPIEDIMLKCKTNWYNNEYNRTLALRKA